ERHVDREVEDDVEVGAETPRRGRTRRALVNLGAELGSLDRKRHRLWKITDAEGAREAREDGVLVPCPLAARREQHGVVELEVRADRDRAAHDGRSDGLRERRGTFPLVNELGEPGE